MRRMVLLLPGLALVGCAALDPRIDSFSVQGLAHVNSFHCAQGVTTDLGYRLVSYEGGNEYFRAERVREDDGLARAVRAYLIVSVARDPASGAERLQVRAERWADHASARIPGSPQPPGEWPTPTPPTPQPGRARTGGPQRVHPGETVGHARRVVRSCATGMVTAE